MDFNLLLSARGIDPKQVVLLRHAPYEPKLKSVFPWLVATRPDLFNAYQQTQTPSVEASLKRSKYVASFVGLTPGSAAFAGLYSIDGMTSISKAQYWNMPAYAELRDAYEMRGFAAEDRRTEILLFDLQATDFCASWKGRLIIEWPATRTWRRLADRNSMPITAILEESLFTEAMPSWDRLSLSLSQIAVLPPSWRAKLSEWRGIYYIFDTESRLGYVGAAYGSDNLLGRWMSYSASGHGGNKLLRDRQPDNFLFSILQRVSPDMAAEDVINLEVSWKDRLHSRQPYGLNAN